MPLLEIATAHFDENFPPLHTRLYGSVVGNQDGTAVAVEGLPVQSVVNPRQRRAQSFSALSRSVTANLKEMLRQGADPLPATLPRLRSPSDVTRDAQGEPFNSALRPV